MIIIYRILSLVTMGFFIASFFLDFLAAHRFEFFVLYTLCDIRADIKCLEEKT